VLPVSVEPGSVITVNFGSWKTGNQEMLYNVKVCSNMPGDENPRNDTMCVQLLTFPLIDSIEAGLTEVSPQINGVLDTIEWKDATVVDGSDILGVDSADSCETCLLYFMNSNSTLYIGCKAESIEEFRVYLDESGDGLWDREGNEGYYSITENGYSFQDMYYHLVYPLADGLGAMAAGGVEISIPIGVQEPYQVPPTELMRCFVRAREPSGYSGWWPQSIRTGHHNNPAYYARIGITGVGVEEVETRHHMSLHVHPNPATHNVVVEFMGRIAPPAAELLHIYDLSGRLIKSLTPRVSPSPGLHVAKWDGRNDAGKPVQSGIYLLVYRTDNDRITKKITILH
jgi:hypothetical protein